MDWLMDYCPSMYLLFGRWTLVCREVTEPSFTISRYSQGAVYRPHIDGSWPGGGLSKQGKYETNEASRSRLTFLVYLNDG